MDKIVGFTCGIYWVLFPHFFLSYIGEKKGKRRRENWVLFFSIKYYVDVRK